MDYFRRARSYLLESPLLQAALDVSLTALVGIFSGTFVAEVTIDGKISWKSWHLTVSFYILMALLVLIVAYKRIVVEAAASISLFKDKDFCVAYARSQMLPEAARKAKEKIRSGNGGELLDAMEEIKKVLQ